MTCYEYICPLCKKRFDRDFPIGTAPQQGINCPRCGGNESERVFTNPWVSWVVYPHNNPYQAMTAARETPAERDLRMDMAGGKHIE